MAGWLTQAARVHKDRGASNLAERDGTFHAARTVDRRYSTAVESDRPADHRSRRREQKRQVRQKPDPDRNYRGTS